jgi:hypothetical protein
LTEIVSGTALHSTIRVMLFDVKVQRAAGLEHVTVDENLSAAITTDDPSTTSKAAGDLFSEEQEVTNALASAPNSLRPQIAESTQR